MTDNSDNHDRHSIRLYGFDYTIPGYYYVTICTQKRACTLGIVNNDMVFLSSWGRLAYSNWRAIPKHFQSVELDHFVVMPNHVHGIVIIQDSDNADTERKLDVNDTISHRKHDVGAQHAAPLTGNVKPGSLGASVRINHRSHDR